MSDSPLLRLDGVTKRFGVLTAVDDVSFDIGPNADITALIGPNGAGKTTTYNLITGKLQPTNGRILFKGFDINGDSVAERTRKGIGRSFQITNIFEDFTVRQNLRAPVIARSDSRYDALGRIDDNDAINEEVDRMLDHLGLENIASQTVENLSYGDKRKVELGITLTTEPSLVLLDEPTAGMTPQETQEMVSLIEGLNDETEVSFFLTEHDMDVVFSISSRIVVLDRGAIIADGTPRDIRRDDQVEHAYLGSDEGFNRASTKDQSRLRERKQNETPVLEVDAIDTFYGQSHVLKEVSLGLYEGEIVSILGRNGAGKTTTLRSIVGFTPPKHGEIRFKGEIISGKRPFEISRVGIGFSPEERRIFSDLTVHDNIDIALNEESDRTIEEIYDLFPRLEERSNNKGHQLSGGEQQMLAIARALATDPELLVLDEPSEGLAPTIIDDLHDALSDIIELDISVLLTEQNVEFALSLAERNYILNNGVVEWHGTTDELMDRREVIDEFILLSGVGTSP